MISFLDLVGASAGMAEQQYKMASNWDDLSARATSAVVMVVVGIFGVVAGGIWFQMLVVLASAVMIWELWSMIAPQRTTAAALLSALASTVMSAQLVDAGTSFALLFLIVPVIGALLLKKMRYTFLLYGLVIMVAGYALIHFRNEFGALWIVWMLLVVIASDVLGYFAGRSFGGPKFWPAISPKKTWSGTVAGWIGAGVIGLIFAIFTDAGLILVPLSMLLSFAGQMGDIAESAIKRRTGIKDSSTLIPGHGGFLDRFDALLGVALVMFIAASVFDLSGVAF